MKARVQVYDRTGVSASYVGLLPTVGLTFSEEVGGAGTCTFEALKADVDALNAWDSVIKIALESAPNVWFLGPCYVMRKEYSHRVGSLRYSFTCRSLLEAWADETVLLPEYIVGSIPRHAGTERGLGWMSSAYPLSDPLEPWDKNFVTTRSTYPAKWPTASNARWISARAVSGQEGKFFRSTMTIPAGAPKTVKFWLSSDESATLWVAGEKLIETSSSETGYETFETAKRVLYPGTYAIGIYSVSDNTVSGGLPEDPVLMAAGILSSTGVVTSWPEHTDGTWVATRRDVDPPNDVPPGPTPGAMMRYLIDQEAKPRLVSGWAGVGQSYTASLDSYGKSWGSRDIVERMYHYGTTTYWDIFQAFAESDECDLWMTNLTLHCAPRQGQLRSLTFTRFHLNTFATVGTENNGNWVLARSHAGWVTQSNVGSSPRREYAIEVGQSVTTAVAGKVARASLRDAWRVDATGSLNPPQTGWIPYVDFNVGDIVTIRYPATGEFVGQMSITSLSAKAGEGGLLWDLELTEYPPPAVPL